MKKILSTLLIVLALAQVMTSCGAASGDKQPADTNNIKIVATIFPEYDWVRQIIGDVEGIDVDILLKNGVDLHSFNPSTDDIVEINNSDLFIYVGGESDEWVEDLIETSGKGLQTVFFNLLEALGDSVKEEEVVEGMEGEEEEEEGPEYDEHVWLSLRNTATLCNMICDAICKIDPAHEATFKANNEKYTAELAALDAEYKDVCDNAKYKTLVFGDRFPFRYLVDDYGLDYYAAFVGCSAESEASFETIIFLASKIDELGLDTIMQIETSNGSIAQTVKGATTSADQEILTLNSLQSATQENINGGLTYLSAMKDNLNVLKEALN